VLRTLVVPMVRRKVVSSAHGQGVSRLPEGQRVRKGQIALRAIAQVLGDKPFFFGTPSSYDAIAYAFLVNTLAAPFDTELKAEVSSHPNLIAFCERMKATYWADWKG
jgi:glutathione S-transferase